jgi:hypothetical protein
MKIILFLIACLLIPAVLAIVHHVWLLERELRAEMQAGGATVTCRYGVLYGFICGAWSMLFGGIFWSVHQSGPAMFDKWGLFVGVPTALSVLLIWLYLITRITADELGVRSRVFIGWWKSAGWMQIVRVDHTSQPRGWFRLHTADGRVIRVYPGLIRVPELSAMILSRTPADVVAPDTRELLRRSALGEVIGVEQFNQRLYEQPSAMLHLAGGMAVAGLVCGAATWYGYAHEARLLMWWSRDVVQGLRQGALTFAAVFVVWSLTYAAVAAVNAFKRASQRRRDAAAGPGSTPKIQ